MKIYTIKIIGGEPNFILLDSQTVGLLRNSLVKGAIETIAKDSDVMVIKINEPTQEVIEEA